MIQTHFFLDFGQISGLWFRDDAAMFARTRSTPWLRQARRGGHFKGFKTNQFARNFKSFMVKNWRCKAFFPPELRLSFRWSSIMVHKCTNFVYDIFIHIGIYEYMAWIVFNSSKDARWLNQIPGKAENQLPASPCWRLQGHFFFSIRQLKAYRCQQIVMIICRTPNKLVNDSTDENSNNNDHHHRSIIM